MTKYWQSYIEWFNARNERERILIIVVSIVALVSVWLVLISDPQTIKREQLRVQIDNLNKQDQGIQAQINAIVARAKIDPDAGNKQKVSSLLASVNGLNEILQQKMHGFIDPSRMANVLEDVLKQKTNLRLVRLESKPAEYVYAGTPVKENKNTQAGLYRHGFRIELVGSYINTLSYLQALEELSWDFYWDGIDVEIIKYPQAKIVLHLHTLSLKEGWIGV